MSERLLLRAMKGEKATTVVLRGKNLTKVPTLVRKLYHLKTLDLMSNQISKLCPELISLTQLKKLNLGNNKLEEVPEELMYLKNLEILHLFKNLIKSFSPKSFDGLENLNILNMNHNMLKEIPPEINRLQNLRNLSLNNNQLTGIPKELCTLPYLSELHLNYNQIVSIPEEFQTMKNLEKLSLARNLIEVFPVVLCSMSNLKILDIAGNLIQLLPRKIRRMKLGGFYCEENPFLKKLPMFIEERLEVLPLKEIAARFIMNELSEDDPLYQQTVARFPKILEILANDKECMLCGKYILSSGIAGVIFMPPMKNWKTSTDIKELPHETVICSQSCFKERTPDIFQLRKT
ncbi:leucine-rich repeat-containing protein 69 isoform X1 [Sarcophilus harrisii]|uniref:leucine-rich repeat-containing protein 69 isoform X1 n=1 Tax=Sarcophilus harrisii TaxID=9305 RepID=UPI001301D9B5|nr:leucine-rich repeat-containing protein 69 isoform X1 [Sarcophilus harrisii]